MALPNFDDIYKKRTQRDENPIGSSSGAVEVPMPNIAPTNATPAEYAKYLYDSGLQNVFNDYQQNIATLNQQEQKQLQDAYYIREMSRKYLGEYASNLGISDVSGNLIDIYSQYQQNIGEITQQSDMLALNLQQQFQQQQEQIFQQALAQMEVQMGENAQTALFNITTNNIGDMSWTEYLQSQLDSGAIDQQAYQQIYSNVYSAKYEQLQSNISSGFFGFKTDESGNRVPMTAAEYLEENRDWLNTEDFQQLSDLINYSSENNVGTAKLMENVPDFVRMFAPTDSPFVFEMTDGNGNTVYYAAVGSIVDEDTNARNPVSSSDLTEAFQEQYPGSPLNSGVTTFEYKGNFYVFEETPQGAAWRRLQNATQYATLFESLTDEDRKNWTFRDTNSTQISNQFFTFIRDTDNSIVGHTIKAMDAEWEVDTDWAFHGEDFWPGDAKRDIAKYPSSWSEALKGVRGEFLRIFGTKDGDVQGGVVFYEGAFYYVSKSGKIAKFKRK